MCSSGTTGLPKGVQLSQSGIIATASNMNKFVFKESIMGNKETVILGLLPLFHVFGSLVLTCVIANWSGKLVMLPKFEESTFLQSFEKYRCTVAYLVPPLLAFLAKHPQVDRYDLSSLELIICGAAPISKELEQSVKDRLNPNLSIKQLHGMTELTSIVLMQKDIVKPGSVGDSNENVYVKVIDSNGTALGPNQVGELCFKGTLVMMGYINNTVATNAIIDEEGCRITEKKTETKLLMLLTELKKFLNFACSVYYFVCTSKFSNKQKKSIELFLFAAIEHA